MYYLLRNTNELLGFGGVDGVKTGRTANAGNCLIISASQTPESRQISGKVYVVPRRVSVVILGANDRFFAGHQLLGRAWQLERNWAAAGRPKTER
jgi:serine-type D-Ala-D-Ala carboxypeptidase (penicillin-binding protein 5/6)